MILILAIAIYEQELTQVVTGLVVSLRTCVLQKGNGFGIVLLHTHAWRYIAR